MMNKKSILWVNFLICILSITLCFDTSSALGGERLSISVPKANVRTCNDLSCEIAWQAEMYYPIEIIKKEDAWCFFKDYEGDKGWIHISVVGPTETVITAGDGQHSVYKEPNMESEKAFIVEKGVPFKQLEKNGRWIHIQHADGDEGWIYDSLVW